MQSHAGHVQTTYKSITCVSKLSTTILKSV